MIRIGTKVTMNDKYWVSNKNKGKEFIVKSKPYEMCGTICVMLEDYRGCYALDGLDEIVEKGGNE